MLSGTKRFFGFSIPRICISCAPDSNSFHSIRPIPQCELVRVPRGVLKLRCVGFSSRLTASHEHVYFRGPESHDNSPLYQYFLMPTEYHHRMNPSRMEQAELDHFLPYVDHPVLRVPGIPEFGIHEEIFENRCFNIQNDYHQQNDLCGTKVEIRMKEKLVKAMKDVDSQTSEWSGTIMMVPFPSESQRTQESIPRPLGRNRTAKAVLGPGLALPLTHK